jgi:hypothetical protein
LYDDVTGDVLEKLNLLLIKWSGTTGLEPTLRALVFFAVPEIEGILAVGEAGILSRSSALPIFSNIARALWNRAW